MKNPQKYPCAAAAVVSTLFLAGTGGCDVASRTATPAISAGHLGAGMLSGALSTGQAALTDMFASVADAVGDGPRELLAKPDPEALPDPNTVYIESITALGKGCPNPGTVASVISPDQKSFILIFTEMELTYPGSPPKPKKQATNCQAAIQLHVPNGFQLSIASVVSRGYADLDFGFEGSQYSSFFFAGVPLSNVSKLTVTGPFEGIYDSPAPTLFGTLATSHCGESALLGMNTTLSLKAPASGLGEAIFNTTSADGAFQMLFHINLSACP